MRQSYQVVSPKDSRQLSEFLAKEGQFLLPMLDLLAVRAGLHDDNHRITSRPFM